MNCTNFMYWLQGFFEIRNSENPLTKEQAIIIQDHIKEVDYLSGEAGLIISFINGALEFYDPIKGNTDSSLTMDIQDKVQGFFVKVTPERKLRESEEMVQVPSFIQFSSGSSLNLTSSLVFDFMEDPEENWRDYVAFEGGPDRTEAHARAIARRYYERYNKFVDSKTFITC